MTHHYRLRPITGYRVLPPKWKIVEPEPPSASRYVKQADGMVRAGQPEALSGPGSDILSLVFDSQLRKSDLSSYQQASVIAERQALLQRHLDGVQWRLDDLGSRRPLRTLYDIREGKLCDVERQILDLEKQKRALELAVWKDTHELRSQLMSERIDRDALRRRMGYLGALGGQHA